MRQSEGRPPIWRERKKGIQQRLAIPLHWIEWLCEWIAYGLSRWAFLDILEKLGRLTILTAVIFYFAESEQRLKQKHYQAWQTINLAQGKPGSGGRIDALQDLNEDGVSLTGVDLSQAYLVKIDLEGAVLREANFREANLDSANLQRARLRGANFQGANLVNANLQRANLINANLQEARGLGSTKLQGTNLAGAKLMYTNFIDANLEEAKLGSANLQGANLSSTKLQRAYLHSANLQEAVLANANLQEVDLTNVNLQKANLWQANLRGVNFAFANLQGADLRQANLQGITEWKSIKGISQANVNGVKKAPEGFVEWAISNGAVSVESDDWRTPGPKTRGHRTR